MMQIQVPFKNKLVLINIISGIVLFLVIGASIFFYSRYQMNTAGKRSGAEVETTAVAVAKLMELPVERPTVATVSDVSKLKDQDFFRKAQNGDKVLIFKQAQKVILYRPITNKIIEVGPIRVDQPEQSQVAGAATENVPVTAEPTIPVVSVTEVPAESPVTIAIYNGSNIAGLTQRTSEKIIQEYPDVTVTTMQFATGTYQKNLVVDLSGNHAAKAESIAKFLNGAVDTLPLGEASSAADLVIILGSE